MVVQDRRYLLHGSSAHVLSKKMKDRVRNTSRDHTVLIQAAAELEQAGRKHGLGSPHIPQPQALLLKQQQCCNEHCPSLWLTNSPPIPACCEFEGEERRGVVRWSGLGGEHTAVPCW